MRLTQDESRLIVYSDNEDFETVSDVMKGTTRWSVQHTIVARRKSDGKLFTADYQVGATESQDEQPFEYEPIVDWTEVKEVQKTITAYEPVKEQD